MYFGSTKECGNSHVFHVNSHHKQNQLQLKSSNQQMATCPTSKKHEKLLKQDTQTTYVLHNHPIPPNNMMN